MSQLFKLSPSDFGFLYDECKRCFYLKVKHGFLRPRSIMPSIFIKIDGIMKDHFEGKSPKDITDTLPEGKIEFGSKWIQSRPFTDKNTGNKCYIKGVTDTVLGFNDSTYGVIDFKTSAKIYKEYYLQVYGYAQAVHEMINWGDDSNKYYPKGMIVRLDKNEDKFQEVAFECEPRVFHYALSLKEFQSKRIQKLKI